MKDQHQADLAACRAMLRGGSRSFFLAALMLPRRVHQPATALYAFCRVADDLIDAGGPTFTPALTPAFTPAFTPTPALQELRRRLDAIYAARPQASPPDRALAHVVASHRIPRLLLDQLLEGFAWDAEGRRYEDLPALHAYAARVAGTVGAMMAILMGVRAPSAVARACDLGIAMQLSNIARDVGEDARAGRLYLPLSWMREAGLDPHTFLADPHPSPALTQVIQRLLTEADRLYRRADSGIAALPLSCRPGIGAARRLYAEIGHQVARNGHDPISTRARVRPLRKLGLAGHSLVAAFQPASPQYAPPLAATSSLVASITAMPASARARRYNPQDRLLWVLTLFSELDQRQTGGG